MREFVVYCTKASKPDTRNIPEGRFDVIARCANSALWTSHGLREARIHFFLSPASRVLSVDNNIKQVSPDERSIVLWIDKVMNGRENPVICVEDMDFDGMMNGFQGRNVYLLDEGGEDVEGMELDEDGVFILGDHEGIPESVIKNITSAKKVSIGPRSYLASQCITFINILLDRKKGKL